MAAAGRGGGRRKRVAVSFAIGGVEMIKGHAPEPADLPGPAQVIAAVAVRSLRAAVAD